jgi:hypothetical protein
MEKPVLITIPNDPTHSAEPCSRQEASEHLAHYLKLGYSLESTDESYHRWDEWTLKSPTAARPAPVYTETDPNWEAHERAALRDLEDS